MKPKKRALSSKDDPAMIHPLAVVEPGAVVGARTRVWAFAHVLAGARVGCDCNICDHTFIEGGARVGDRVTLKCGVFLWDGVCLEDDVFVGPSASFTNDRFPRSRQRPARFLDTVVEQGASIGAAATILPGIRIGRLSMVGAGAVVTRDVPPYAIVRGNPARIYGYVDAIRQSQPTSETREDLQKRGPGGARWIQIPNFSDMRGELGVIEWPALLPFTVRRIFYVYAVPSANVRGAHAHKCCHQFLVAVSGSLRVVADDGNGRQEYELNSPRRGVYLPPGVWGTQYMHTPGTVCLVLASHPYDPSDYIRDYEEYLQWRRRK